MRWTKVGVACGALALAVGGHQVAFAQTRAADLDQLMGMDIEGLKVAYKKQQADKRII